MTDVWSVEPVHVEPVQAVVEEQLYDADAVALAEFHQIIDAEYAEIHQIIENVVERSLAPRTPDRSN